MKLKLFGVFSVLLAISKCIKCDNIVESPSWLNCSDLNPQKYLEKHQLIGAWYGYEIISHRDNEETKNTCVVIHINDRTEEVVSARPHPPDSGYEEFYHRNVFQYDLNNQNPFGSQYYQYLHLTWSQDDLDVDYNLRFNTSRPGFLTTSSLEKGTMMKLNYDQFSGVQVIEVLNNHIILTFCVHQPHSQFFSILLTRNPNSISMDELERWRFLLTVRGLKIVSPRRICNGCNSVQRISIVSLFVLAAVALYHKN